MPAPRGTETLCDLVDHAVETAGRYTQTVAMVVEDGVVTHAERRLLEAAATEFGQALAVLPGRTSELDMVMVLIGALAGTGAITAHVYRKVREAWEDIQRSACAEQVAS